MLLHYAAAEQLHRRTTQHRASRREASSTHAGTCMPIERSSPRCPRGAVAPGKPACLVAAQAGSCTDDRPLKPEQLPSACCCSTRAMQVQAPAHARQESCLRYACSYPRTQWKVLLSLVKAGACTRTARQPSAQAAGRASLFRICIRPWIHGLHLFPPKVAEQPRRYRHQPSPGRGAVSAMHAELCRHRGECSPAWSALVLGSVQPATQPRPVTH